MNVEKKQIEENTSTMCKICKAFYGSQSYDGCCSACWKKQKHDEKHDLSIKEKPAEAEIKKVKVDCIEQKMEQQPKQPVQKSKKRCYDCNKKVGLLGIQCRCGLVFCNAHRLPEDHNCKFDYAAISKQKLEKEMIRVSNGKITEI